MTRGRGNEASASASASKEKPPPAKRARGLVGGVAPPPPTATTTTTTTTTNPGEHPWGRGAPDAPRSTGGDDDDGGDDDGDDDDFVVGEGNDETRENGKHGGAETLPRPKAAPLRADDIPLLNVAERRAILSRWNSRLRALKNRARDISYQFPTANVSVFLSKPFPTERRHRWWYVWFGLVRVNRRRRRCERAFSRFDDFFLSVD